MSITTQEVEQYITEDGIEKMPLTCIICPIGCLMEVTVKNDTNETIVLEVKDNTCSRGEDYAKKELIDPTRTLTTTITVLDGESPLVPVKSDGEVPKGRLLDCMEIIRRKSVKAPIKRGDILIKDILGTSVNIIACADISK